MVQRPRTHVGNPQKAWQNLKRLGSTHKQRGEIRRRRRAPIRLWARERHVNGNDIKWKSHKKKNQDTYNKYVYHYC